MSELTTFIPAGGLGSRLRPYTYATPKPLLLMGGADRRIIDGSLEISTDVSSRIWVSTDYLGSQVEDYLESRPKIITMRDSGTVGSGGSLIEHYEKFSSLESDGHLLVLPSDHIYDGDFDMRKYLEIHKESGADMTLMTVPAKNYGEYLKVRGKDALSIEELAGDPDTVSTTGTYMFRNRFILDVLWKMQQAGVENPNIYKDIVRPAVGRVAVSHYFISEHEGYWEDTGTLRRYLDSNMRLTGNENVISNEAEIAHDATLRRCVVLGRASVRSGMLIEDAIIGDANNDGNLIMSRPFVDA